MRGIGRATNLSVVQSTHGTLAGLIKHKIATKRRRRRRVKILTRKCRHNMIFYWVKHSVYRESG